MPIHDKSPRPQEFAAVDLGSNSFHMVIARVVDGAMQIIGRLKQRVHLADGLGPDNMLSEEAMTRGLNCLSLFAERLQGFSPASVCIVGTHTLRQALNATDFLKRAEKVIPYPIEIISGNEEARLIFMGVEHTQPEKGRKLVIDIGFRIIIVHWTTDRNTVVISFTRHCIDIRSQLITEQNGVA